MTVAEPKAMRAARAAANIERQRIKQEKAKERRKRLWAINLDRLQQAYPEIFRCRSSETAGDRLQACHPCRVRLEGEQGARSLDA